MAFKPMKRADHQTHGEKDEQDRIIKRFSPRERLDATLEGECVHLYRMDSGWGFARIWIASEKLGVSITGTLGGELYDGARVRVHGFWSRHDRYGWQVKLRALEVLLATSADGVIAWFQDRFPDVGPVRARSLLDTFKEEIWNVVEHEPSRLAEAPQIGDKLAEQIHHTYINYKHEREAYVYLAKIGLGPEAIKKAFGLWGRETQQHVNENPYILTELPGVGFKQADRVARQAGVKAVDKRRIIAGYAYAMEILERNGSTCATGQKLIATAANTECLGLSLQVVRAHFDAAVEAGGLVGEFGMFFRREMADAEHLIAQQVYEFLQHKKERRGVMARFLLVRYQGGGCDYTIGCGLAVDEIVAEDFAAAVEYLHQMVLQPDSAGAEEFYLKDPDQVLSADLYEITRELELPLAQWRKELASSECVRDAQEQEARERAELERLKKKYEG